MNISSDDSSIIDSIKIENIERPSKIMRLDKSSTKESEKKNLNKDIKKGSIIFLFSYFNKFF